MYRKFNHHQSHHFHDKKLDTQGAETPRFPSSSETSAPRPKGFASSVRLSRAPPPLLQFARPLFNRLSAFSTVHHPSLHLPFVLVYFFQFIRARFYPVARSSSSGSSLPSLRFLPAFDLSAPLIRIYRGRIFSPTPSQGSNAFLHIGCSEISTLFASTKDLFSQGILATSRFSRRYRSLSFSFSLPLSLPYERRGSFGRLEMDFETGLLASSSLLLSRKFRFDVGDSRWKFLTSIFFGIFSYFRVGGSYWILGFNFC